MREGQRDQLDEDDTYNKLGKSNMCIWVIEKEKKDESKKLIIKIRWTKMYWIRYKD